MTDLAALRSAIESAKGKRHVFSRTFGIAIAQTGTKDGPAVHHVRCIRDSCRRSVILLPDGQVAGTALVNGCGGGI